MPPPPSTVPSTSASMLQLSAAKVDAVRRLVFSLQRSQASKKRPGRAGAGARGETCGRGGDARGHT